MIAIQKVRNIIETVGVESASDFAWKEYLWAKERKNYRAAAFWIKCYYNWD